MPRQYCHNVKAVRIMVSRRTLAGTPWGRIFGRTLGPFFKCCTLHQLPHPNRREPANNSHFRENQAYKIPQKIRSRTLHSSTVHNTGDLLAPILPIPPISSSLSMAATAARKEDKYSVILPTYNERSNLPIIVCLLEHMFTSK